MVDLPPADTTDLEPAKVLERVVDADEHGHDCDDESGAVLDVDVAADLGLDVDTDVSASGTASGTASGSA